MTLVLLGVGIGVGETLQELCPYFDLDFVSIQHQLPSMAPSWGALVNPFPNTPFWDRPKFKEAADDNWNVVIKGF